MSPLAREVVAWFLGSPDVPVPDGYHEFTDPMRAKAGVSFPLFLTRRDSGHIFAAIIKDLLES